MKCGFYPKIAWQAIKKNYRLYIPYLLTCTGMIMMMYILCSLTNNQTVLNTRGGSTLASMLSLGKIIIAIFSLVFLFYTNSFLLKKRTTELGLYNVLGMDKKNIAKVVACENLLIAAISLISGIILGILFSKLAELCLVKLMGESGNTVFYIPASAIFQTVIVFAAIFLILFINSLIIVRRSKPIELLRRENAGEKPPKANWLLAAAGLVLLAGAYTLAVVIKSPLSALFLFFVAVVMVIIGTNLLFISGSVTVCKALQSNKAFYYKAKNFVSVSSMAYRVRRNGAGLAAVCILCTMVLVTFSSTTCLFLGAEDSIASRYPRDVAVQVCFDTLEQMNEDNISIAHDAVARSEELSDVKAVNWMEYRAATISGMLIDNTLIYDPDAAAAYNDMVATDKVVMCKIISAEDFNASTGSNVQPADDEVYILGYRTTYTGETFRVDGGKEYRVNNISGSTENEILCNSAALIMPTLTVVVNDIFDFSEQVLSMLGEENSMFLGLNWYCGYDVDGGDREQIMMAGDCLANSFFDSISTDRGLECSYYQMDNIEANRDDFYGTYGGLFFVGIVLSIVFLCGAVLIIYYKQISEGYEDQKRFEIMKKVGMTAKNIRQSINSQMLIVFFSPLLLAGIHLAFAFPLVWKILVLFNMANIRLLIVITICAYILFAAFYFAVYKKTSDSYFKIVNGLKSIE